MDHRDQLNSLEEISNIRRMMERSSRFISLSGLSGIATGFCALVGAYFAYHILAKYYDANAQTGFKEENLDTLKIHLLVLAGIVLVAALTFSLLFTLRRAKQNNLPVWDLTAKKLMWNVMIPLVAGGFFILAMIQSGELKLVAAACLVFYGLALINGSKYTLTDIRYLGFLEVILGLFATQFPGESLYFWAAGFGVLHIVYGVIMWTKYEKNNLKSGNS